MENLKELEKNMFKKYSDKFVFFRVIGPKYMINKYMTNRSVFWGGDDYNEFLDIASKLGIKMIYYRENSPINKEKFAEHADDIAGLVLGFMHDGVFHTMTVYADWYDISEDD